MTSHFDPLLDQPLPHVSLSSTSGSQLELPNDILGAWTALYFYPKDDTPGCTKQACSYRDHHDDFSKLDVNIIGVSLDSIESHQAFISKFGLNFTLLADTEHQLSEALGVYGDQTWQGNTFKGLSRDTFLIDPKGIIRKIWRNVDPTTTMAETHAALIEIM